MPIAFSSGRRRSDAKEHVCADIPPGGVQRVRVSQFRGGRARARDARHRPRRGQLQPEVLVLRHRRPVFVVLPDRREQRRVTVGEAIGEPAGSLRRRCHCTRHRSVKQSLLLGFIFHLILHSYDYNRHAEGLLPANLCLVTLLNSEQCSTLERFRLQHVEKVNKTSSFKTILIVIMPGGQS